MRSCATEDAHRIVAAKGSLQRGAGILRLLLEVASVQL